MKPRTSILSLAAAVAASVLALQAPVVSAAGDTAATGAGSSTTQSSSAAQPGVPGVEANVGSNASDRGLPGVEMNVGRDGDQDNTATLGAGPETNVSNGQQSPRPMRVDRG